MTALGGKSMSEDTDKDTGVTSIVAGTNITVDNSNPSAPVISSSAAAAGGQVDSVVGGTNCSVDSSDPVNPIVNADTQNNAKVTTKGDLEGFSTIAARIPVGSNGQVLTADSAEALGLKWATPAAGGGDVATDTIWDVKGDLAGGTGSDTSARLAVGTNGQVLSADSAETTGMKWIAAAGATKIDISSFIQGVLGDSEKVSTFVVATAATLPSALANSKAYAEVVSTANATLDVQVNGVSKGSINFALGANVATFTFASPVVLVVGDRIQLIAQGTADATLADVSITLRGTL